MMGKFHQLVKETGSRELLQEHSCTVLRVFFCVIKRRDQVTNLLL
jgi:hypothetical protein